MNPSLKFRVKFEGKNLRKEEAMALLNPGICPRCKAKLSVGSKGLVFKKYLLKCESCSSVWDEASEFMNEFEEVSIKALREEGLKHWPFEVPVLLKKNEIVYLWLCT